jgi:HAMP domain-containing protein
MIFKKGLGIRTKMLMALMIAEICWASAAGYVVYLQNRLNDQIQQQEQLAQVERDMENYYVALQNAQIGVNLVAAGSEGPGMPYVSEARTSLVDIEKAAWSHPAIPDAEMARLREVGRDYLTAIDRSLVSYNEYLAARNGNVSAEELAQKKTVLDGELNAARTLVEFANLKMVAFREELRAYRQVQNEAMANLRQAVSNTTTGASIFALLVGTTVVSLVTSFIRRRVRGIGSAATRFAEGDLAARAPVKGGDEIATLAENFNHMADELEASTHKLEE